jgi:hypothetical protein
MTTSVPQVPERIPVRIILDRLLVRFDQRWAEAFRTKDVVLMKNTIGMMREAYEALKLRCNDGEIPFERMERVRRALEGMEEAVANLTKAGAI